MLNPHVDINIKNKGFNETIIRNNNKSQRNKINWNSQYDGNEGEISLNIDDNNNKKHFVIQFNNDDLVKLLNIPSVNMSLEKRLQNDFLKKRNQTQKYRRAPMVIEVMQDPTSYDSSATPYDNSNMFNNSSSSINDSLKQLMNIGSLDKISNNSNALTHLSSPNINEEIILPLTIKATPRKRTYTPRAKKVYKVLRVPRTYRKTKSL